MTDKSHPSHQLDADLEIHRAPVAAGIGNSGVIVRGTGRISHRAAIICLAGGCLQIAYGLLAVVFPYPVITDWGFELIWALVNVGMVTGIVGWLSLDIARPRMLARLAGGVAILGHVTRIAVSVWLIVTPSAPGDAAVVVSILLIFLGMGVLGICSVVGRQLPGWQQWVPLSVLATGLGVAALYSVDKVAHFISLGLLWGLSWLLLGWVDLRRSLSHP